MEIKGKVVQVMEVVTGSGKNGAWHKQDFVIESGDKYPKKVCMTLWGEELINKYDLVAGMTVTASIELESREYNGKWFTNVRVWKIQWDEQKRPDFPKKESSKEQTWPEPSKPSVPVSDMRSDVSTDDLPF